MVDKGNSSPLWKSIASHEGRLKEIGQWIIGKGDISFWDDNWTGEILIGPLPCDVQLMVREATQIIDDLRPYIPRHQVAKINAICINPHEKDLLKFSISENMKFSTSLYTRHLHIPVLRELGLVSFGTILFPQRW